ARGATGRTGAEKKKKGMAEPKKKRKKHKSGKKKRNRRSQINDRELSKISSRDFESHWSMENDLNRRENKEGIQNAQPRAQPADFELFKPSAPHMGKDPARAQSQQSH